MRISLRDLTQPSLDDAVARKALPLHFDLDAGRAVLHRGVPASEFTSVDALRQALALVIQEKGIARTELQAVSSKLGAFLRNPRDIDPLKLASCLMPAGPIGKCVVKEQLLQTLFSSYEVRAADVAEGAVGAELGLREGDHVCGGLATALRTNSCTFPWRDSGGEVLHLANGTQLVLPIFVTVNDNASKVMLAYTFTVRTPGHGTGEA